MKTCPKCGYSVEEDSNFCPKCGYNFAKGSANESGNQEIIIDNSDVNHVFIEKRSIALCIVLSIVTCGIYGLYWMYKITEDANTLSSETYNTPGTMVIVLNLLTCGIYGFYWAYMIGKKLALLDKAENKDTSTQGLLYCILYFLVGIICYAIMQVELNKYAY